MGAIDRWLISGVIRGSIFSPMGSYFRSPMITKTLTPLVFFFLLFSSVSAESSTGADELELLRQEIQEQENLLRELKEKLRRLEWENVESYEVSISADGLRAEGEAVNPEELGEILESLPDDTKVMIRVESSIQYEKVLPVVQACASAGLNDVVFATYEAEDTDSQ